MKEEVPPRPSSADGDVVSNVLVFPRLTDDSAGQEVERDGASVANDDNRDWGIVILVVHLLDKRFQSGVASTLHVPVHLYTCMKEIINSSYYSSSIIDAPIV